MCIGRFMAILICNRRNPRAWDFGLEGERGKFSGRVAYFDNRVKNLITTTLVEDVNWKYINVGQARIKGLEVEAGLEA
jgi:outer membrane receptor for ferrienterochelin and colicins